MCTNHMGMHMELGHKYFVDLCFVVQNVLHILYYDYFCFFIYFFNLSVHWLGALDVCEMCNLSEVCCSCWMFIVVFIVGWHPGYLVSLLHNYKVLFVISC